MKSLLVHQQCLTVPYSDFGYYKVTYSFRDDQYYKHQNFYVAKVAMHHFFISKLCYLFIWPSMLINLVSKLTVKHNYVM